MTTTKRNPKSVKKPGDVFGFLTLIEHMKGGEWRCRCSCGKYATVKTGNLTGGNTTSCGCQQFNKMTPEQKAAHRAKKKVIPDDYVPVTGGQVERLEKLKAAAQGDALLELQNLWTKRS